MLLQENYIQWNYILKLLFYPFQFPVAYKICFDLLQQFKYIFWPGNFRQLLLLFYQETSKALSLYYL